MRPLSRSLLIVLLVLNVALFASSSVAALQTTAARAILSPAATRLAAYLAVDTTNPPGNERAGAELLASLLRAAGVEPQLFVSPRGRVSLLARLEASPRPRAGSAGADGVEAAPPRALATPPGALVLLHHIDTVPAGTGWRHAAPAAGEVLDGELWGRGAIDAKGLGIAHLMAFLDLARSPLPRRRAVVFLAVADEEAGGGEGAGWLLNAHPELFSNVDAVLNEGGVNKAVAGRTLFWGVEVDQKRPLWLEVAAAGRPGHASAANPDSATHRLVSGLAALVAAPRPRRVTPAATQFLSALARFDPQARAALAELRELETRGDASLSRPLSLPGFESLLTDTLQVTTLTGSERINVVAGEARAGIDVRLLPDTDEKAFVRELEKTLGPGLTVSVRLTSPAASPSSATSLDYRTIASVLQAPAPSATLATPVVPAFIPAFTDSRFFRARGIAAYGFSPFALDGLLLRTVHAPDERIPLAVLDRGVETMTRVVSALVLSPAPSSPSNRAIP